MTMILLYNDGHIKWHGRYKNTITADPIMATNYKTIEQSSFLTHKYIFKTKNFVKSF